MALDPRVVPVAEALRDEIAGKRRSLASVERDAGFSEKYLYKLLSGSVEMKVVHVFQVLQALGVEPRDFFARLGGYQPREPLDDVLRRLAALEKRAGGGS